MSNKPIKYLSGLLLLLAVATVLGFSRWPKTVPQVENDTNWTPYCLVDGTMIPRDVTSFYREYYPDYYDNNQDVMSLLAQQYLAMIALIVNDDNSFYRFDHMNIDLSGQIEKIIDSEYEGCSCHINGYRNIDKTDGHLFNRLYKWYNFGYSDGFYQNIFNDQKMYEITGKTRKVLLSASVIADCTISDGEDYSSDILLYFDKDSNYLFNIIVR